MMTKADVLVQFRELWRDAVRARPSLRGDDVARREAWNDYTDALQKDGLISARQYDPWSGPFRNPVDRRRLTTRRREFGERTKALHAGYTIHKMGNDWVLTTPSKSLFVTYPTKREAEIGRAVLARTGEGARGSRLNPYGTSRWSTYYEAGRPVQHYRQDHKTKAAAEFAARKLSVQTGGFVIVERNGREVLSFLHGQRKD